MSLRVESVSLVLGDGDQQVQALDNVTFSVAPGELLAVVGPSGSGKSSLLAVCGGLRRPTSGRIHVGDTEITALHAEQLTRVRREKIGFVLPAVQPAAVADRAGPAAAHRAPARHESRLPSIATGPWSSSSRSAWRPAAGRRPAELSGGERQRVGYRPCADVVAQRAARR